VQSKKIRTTKLLAGFRILSGWSQGELGRVSGHEMARTIIRRELNQAQIDLAFVEKDRSSRKTQADLYAELKSKVLA